MPAMHMAGRARQEGGEERKGWDARRGMADKRKRALWWTWRKYADLFRLTDDRWRPRVERGKKRLCARAGRTDKKAQNRTKQTVNGFASSLERVVGMERSEEGKEEQRE